MASFNSTKAPGETESLTNKVFFSRNDFNDRMKYVILHTETGGYLFCGEAHAKIAPGKIGLNTVQRKWGSISLEEPLQIQTHQFNYSRECLGSCALAVDLNSKKNVVADPLNADAMAKEFCMQFTETPLTVGQSVLFKFENKLLLAEVKSLTAMSSGGGDAGKCKFGLLMANSLITWETQPTSRLLLVGRALTAGGSSSGGGGFVSILSPNWNFEEMGIGGLDKEFSDIFRRTFASRMFPPAIGQQLGLKHVRGILLFGPPGTGKTLMARQIGKMLNAREPKIVNGPSILDKYVGESEANIRKLFADAEEEEKRMGVRSALHIIIYDEIDAICKTRGSSTAGSGVHDTVVNQLLTKLDGVDQLNNVLVIGMTNRRDMIDEALLRPGRLELQMEISLPSEDGRLQILAIHTGKMQRAGKLAPDVNLRELASKTKNFSGAEIEGLCRAAAYSAMYELVDAKDKTNIDPNAIERLLVKRSHFIYAIDHDIKPLFGTSEEELSVYVPRGIIQWGDSVAEARKMGHLAVSSASDPDVERCRPLTLLLEGQSKAGKTALAVEIAKSAGFPFVKIVTSHKMIGYTENAKCNAMKKIFDDGAKSPLSIIIVDNLEGLIEYNPVGPRFSNTLSQAIRDLVTQPLKPDRRMLVIGTTSCRAAMTEQQLLQAFSWHVRVGMLTQPKHIMAVLEEDDRFTQAERTDIERMLQNQPICIGIKHLIDLIDLVSKTDPTRRSALFLAKIEEEASLVF